jgi:hypothetical protein
VQALQRVAHRYARALGLTLRDLQQVAQGQAPQISDDEAAGRNDASDTGDADSARRVA